MKTFIANDTEYKPVYDKRFKDWKMLTAALNPKTKERLQKFGFDKGNRTAVTKEELLKSYNFLKL